MIKIYKITLIVCAVIGCIGANAETTGRPRSDHIGSIYNEGHSK